MSTAPEVIIGKGKRPAMSLRTRGDHEESRSMKSMRSSGERFDDALSKISNFSSVALEDRQSRRQRGSEFSVERAQGIVNVMALSDEWLLEACILFAERGNENRRIVFIRFNDAQRYAYITRLMREKDLA